LLRTVFKFLIEVDAPLRGRYPMGTRVYQNFADEAVDLMEAVVAATVAFGSSVDADVVALVRQSDGVPTPGAIIGNCSPIMTMLSAGTSMPLLAAAPYDLGHAAVSTWLAGGVPPTHVAEWAGQSVEILFLIYAKCLDRGEAELHRRVETALGRRPSIAQSLPASRASPLPGHVLPRSRRPPLSPWPARSSARGIRPHGSHPQHAIVLVLPYAKRDHATQQVNRHGLTIREFDCALACVERVEIGVESLASAGRERDAGMFGVTADHEQDRSGRVHPCRMTPLDRLARLGNRLVSQCAQPLKYLAAGSGEAIDVLVDRLWLAHSDSLPRPGRGRTSPASRRARSKTAVSSRPYARHPFTPATPRGAPAATANRVTR
jgi:hypothetical protein